MNQSQGGSQDAEYIATILVVEKTIGDDALLTENSADTHIDDTCSPIHFKHAVKIIGCQLLLPPSAPPQW